MQHMDLTQVQSLEQMKIRLLQGVEGKLLEEPFGKGLQVLGADNALLVEEERQRYEPRKLVEPFQ